MTRKDYVKFAKMLSRVKGQQDETAGLRLFIVHQIADIFATDNPRFDRERFYKACEPKGE